MDSSIPAKCVVGAIVKVLAIHIRKEKAGRMYGRNHHSSWVFGVVVAASKVIKPGNVAKSWEIHIR